MKNADRKAAVAAYKEKKVEAGIYAVRCRPTGQVWVGSAPNLDTIRNRIWFSLGNNGYPGRSLQNAWSEHQPGDFAFEIVERSAEEADAYFRAAELKKRLAEWREKLNADLV
jgi:hypothetical protein